MLWSESMCLPAHAMLKLVSACSLGAHAQTKKAVQEPGSHKDFWMNAFGVLAIAVLSILFAKGKLRVRTV